MVVLHVVSEVSGLADWHHERSFEKRLLAGVALTVAVGVCLRAVPSLVSDAAVAVGLAAGAALLELGRLAASLLERT